MKTRDFRGIVKLDRPLVEQLESYLQEKETHLSLNILNAIHFLPNEEFHVNEEQIKLGKAVETLNKKLNELVHASSISANSQDWAVAAREINSSAWDYVEVLEGCVSELFLQLRQLGFENWDKELMGIVESVKELLSRCMDDLIEKVKKLETLLEEYRGICEKSFKPFVLFRKKMFFWKSILDKSLLSFLNKSKSFLTIRYQEFQQRFSDYLKLKNKIQESTNKFKGYEIFKSLETGVKRDLESIYKLLKLWEFNGQAKILPFREPVRVLRNGYGIEKSTTLFLEYFTALKMALFDQSRRLKQDPQEIFFDETSRKIIGDNLQGFRAELHTLSATIAKYRDFFLRTHPSPYVRTRWGFVEWLVGPEPEQTKDLLNLGYKTESLDKLYESLLQALKKGPPLLNISESITNQALEAHKILHEMEQPLISKSMMKNKAEYLLELIKKMDELGSFDPQVVNEVGKILLKAMRADWQYNILFEFTLFHQLFDIHKRVLGLSEDRQHIGRLNKFREMIRQFQEWIKLEQTLGHTKEMETDIHDMKYYLQDFLAYIQRSVLEVQDKDKATIKINEVAEQLLEYRYLFGQFFHELHLHEPEGKLVRNQFLFVDQYFEAVEIKLQELRTTWDL